MLIFRVLARQHSRRTCAGQLAEEGPAMIVGKDQFKYRVNADWAKLPAGWSFKEVGGVGLDGNDNVYVFTAASTR
jgi:hypothetical protein